MGWLSDRRGVGFAAVLFLGVLGAPACSSVEGDDTQTAQARIYSAAIRSVVADRSGGGPDAAPPGPVFVATRPDEPIGLEVQVEVVVGLEDWATIRFIDELDEAVDSGDPAETVREDGILLSLGGLPEDLDSPVVVDVHVHTGPDTFDAYRVEVRERGDAWTVSDPLTPVPETRPSEE